MPHRAKIEPQGIMSPSKKPKRVQVRNLVCYRAIKELGLAGTAVAKLLGLVQSSMSGVVEHGSKIAAENQLTLYV